MIKNRSIKAVIFDLDGTIAETIPLIIKSMQHALEPLIEKGITATEITDTFGPSEVGTVMALAPNHIEEGFSRYLKFYSEFHNMCPSPFDGVTKLLHKIKQKGIRIALVTGKSKESATIDLQCFHLENIFEIIETGIPERPSKPECIERVISYFEDIPKENIIYVGDAPTDIDVCNEVGIRIVSAAWAKSSDYNQLSAKKPDFIFSEISEFSNWILRN